VLLLTSTGDKLQLVTTAAVATHVQASYVDNAAGTITPGRLNTVISTAATTDVVAAPAASTQRNVKHLSVKAVGGAQTVTVKHTDGTTAVEVSPAVPLAQGETLIWTDGLGWQVLDATGAVKQSGQPSAGRFLKRTTYTTGSGNHTTDAKASLVRLYLVGGGGGGGGTTTTTTAAAAAGGGGAGAYVEKAFVVSPSTAYAYAVGAGGTAGPATGAAGGTGGNTTFGPVGGTTVTAAGGVGGTGQTAGTTAAAAAGGAGGTATNADVGVTGSAGFTGNRQSGTVGWSGDGADSTMGGGGAGKYTAGAGATATGFGAGGSGGLVLNASAAVAGGAGSAGVVIVDEYT
jgi:hypothetical protein